MQDSIIRELVSKLERFEKKLRSRKEAYVARGILPTDGHMKYDRFDEKRRDIQSRLKARLEGSSGIVWELLKLELQNDLLLLTSSFEHWSQQLDAKYNRQKQG
ncbi:MAG: hypothetical protein ACREIP_21910 [Alphaproteobacteria bacterium]